MNKVQGEYHSRASKHGGGEEESWRTCLNPAIPADLKFFFFSRRLLFRVL